MLVVNTCKAAIEALSDIYGMDVACKRVFAKMRHCMINPDGNTLNLELVNELRPVLEHGGGNIYAMNDEYLAAKAVAEREVQARRDMNHLPANWIPPAWRAPAFGVLSDMAGEHTELMDKLRDRVIGDWQREKGYPMSATQLKMYLGGMAALSVYNAMEKPADEEVTFFDGDEP